MAGEVMMALATLRDAGQKENDYSWGPAVQPHRPSASSTWTPRTTGSGRCAGSRSLTHGRATTWTAFNEGLRAVREHGLAGTWSAGPGRGQAAHRDLGEGLQPGAGTISPRPSPAPRWTPPCCSCPRRVFTAPDPHPAMPRTVERIERDLERRSTGSCAGTAPPRAGQSADGLSGEEVPFVICTFWLVVVVRPLRTGPQDAAQLMRTRTVGFASDLGLLSEEYDVARASPRGQLPPGFQPPGTYRAGGRAGGGAPRGGVRLLWWSLAEPWA
ncbi:hypothetical protein QJS66_14960 [Kocuria rhizophila]|nr:hypothetical protein QJS66_14960 [Kocuria rhizophila]